DVRACAGDALRTGAARTRGRTLAALPQRLGSGSRLPLGAGAGGHLALVDPHLDADAAERGAGLVEAVVDVGPQGDERDPAAAVELRAAHLRATQPSRALDPDALDARALQRRLHALA